MAKMGVRELAQITGLSTARIYQLRKTLGRNPTVEEIMERKGKIGVPPKEHSKNWAMVFIGKKRNFDEVMRMLKDKYGENATLQEICEAERK
jgi:hypothetical protein